ncbi:MAG TPA: CU044_5270 family protein [Mycobacterium sp.]
MATVEPEPDLRALDAVEQFGAVDDFQLPGQYRYVETHSWWAGTSGRFVSLVEHMERIWIPSDPDDPAQDWMLDRGPTGNRVWLRGNEEEARAEGFWEPAPYPTIRVTAPCGNFYDSRPCDRHGSWQDPTAEFLAKLPRNPEHLLQQLHAAAPAEGNRSASARIYSYIADMLRTGRIPAGLRTTLYQVLARLPGIVVTVGVTDLHKRSGTALGMDDGLHRRHLIIDPTTGAVLGERSVTSASTAWLPNDTVTTYTAVSTAVVPTLGTCPLLC